MAEKPTKKVVRSTAPATRPAGKAATPKAGGKGTDAPERAWSPTVEAKSKATRLRVIAFVLWALAIAGEAVAIFWILKPTETVQREGNTTLILLIAAIVVVGILAIVANTLWKKANRLDPASKAQPVRFFIQNQLGAIITVIAFLPLIILILTSKNIDKTQKTIATVVAIVVALAATLFGIDFNPPSAEQFRDDQATVIALTGEDEVFWVKGGKVYHLCAEASDLQRESEDNTIYSGTVDQAIHEGKSRLTKKVEQEINQCGLTPPADWDGGEGSEETEEDPVVEESPAA